MDTDAIATAGLVFATLHAAHQVADHWVQSDHQARHKGDAGLMGHWACFNHVFSYFTTQVVFLAVVQVIFHVNVVTPWSLLILIGNGATHYFVDRRKPLVWLAGKVPGNTLHLLGVPRQHLVEVRYDHAGNVMTGTAPIDSPCLGTGAYALDQSWHVGWLWVTTLAIAVIT